MKSIRNQLEALQVEHNEKYQKNEIGLAQLFYDLYQDKICFVKERNQWFVYDGRRWCSDSNALQVMEYCKDFANELISYAMDKDHREFINVVKRLAERKRRVFLIKDARSISPKSFQEFDRNPFLFNCKNGTYNLKTFELQPHNEKDYITQLANVVYDESVICDRWLSFIEEVTLNDKELGLYIQQMFGYCLTGSTIMECLFILYGKLSRNGKSTTIETVGNLLGDYFKNVQPETLSKYKRNGSSPTPDLARLKGARLVNVPEPEKDLKLNESLIKQLTGGDTVTGRHLHEDFIEFKPEFKILMNTNHLPRVEDETIFASNRIHIIPFDRHFKEEERDNTLKFYFQEESNKSGILNWMIEGYRQVVLNKMKPTDRMEKLVKSYARKTNVFELFADECFVTSIKNRIPLNELYSIYVTWCLNNGYSYVERKDFKGIVEKDYIVKRNGKRGLELVGKTVIELTESDSSE